jgi:hypothetical protein
MRMDKKNFIKLEKYTEKGKGGIFGNEALIPGKDSPCLNH